MNSNKHRRLYEYTEIDLINDNIIKLEDLLIGAFCYGDDGEDAYITDIYYDEDVYMVSFRQIDGREFDFPLADYLDNIDVDDAVKIDVKEIIDYSDDTHINEGVVKPNRYVTVVLDSDDSDTVNNFLVWARELLNLIKYPVPEKEFIYIKDGFVHYRINNIGLNAGIVKKLEVKIARYANNSNFPAGLELNPERAEFTLPLELTGTLDVYMKTK